MCLCVRVRAAVYWIPSLIYTRDEEVDEGLCTFLCACVFFVRVRAAVFDAVLLTILHTLYPHSRLRPRWVVASSRGTGIGLDGLSAVCCGGMLLNRGRVAGQTIIYM